MPPPDLAHRRGLREQPICEAAWREAACPSSLLASAAAAIDGAKARGRAGALAALPTFVEDARTIAKDRARSSMRAALDKFMQSEEGQQWAKDGKALFPLAKKRTDATWQSSALRPYPGRGVHASSQPPRFAAPAAAPSRNALQ